MFQMGKGQYTSLSSPLDLLSLLMLACLLTSHLYTPSLPLSSLPARPPSHSSSSPRMPLATFCPSPRSWWPGWRPGSWTSKCSPRRLRTRGVRERRLNSGAVGQEEGTFTRARRECRERVAQDGYRVLREEHSKPMRIERQDERDGWMDG